MEQPTTTLTPDQEAVLVFLANECENVVHFVSKPVGLYIVMWGQALSYGLFGQAGIDRMTGLVSNPPLPEAPEELGTVLDDELVLNAQSLGYAACFQLWQLLQVDPTMHVGLDFLKDANRTLGHLTRRFFGFVGVNKTITDAVNHAVKQAAQLADRFDEFRKAALLAGVQNDLGQPTQQSAPQSWLNLSPDGTIN